MQNSSLKGWARVCGDPHPYLWAAGTAAKPFGDATPHVAAQLTAHWAVEQNCAAPPSHGEGMFIQSEAKDPFKRAEYVLRWFNGMLHVRSA